MAAQVELDPIEYATPVHLVMAPLQRQLGRHQRAEGGGGVPQRLRNEAVRGGDAGRAVGVGCLIAAAWFNYINRVADALGVGRG